VDLSDLEEVKVRVNDPDGQRFVVLPADHTKSASISLLTNWPPELKR
jgi:hypothetical protein